MHHRAVDAFHVPVTRIPIPTCRHDKGKIREPLVVDGKQPHKFSTELPIPKHQIDL